MADPSITLDRNFAAAPSTTRGQAVQLSADPKGQRIAYAVSLSWVLASLPSNMPRQTLYIASPLSELLC